MPKEVIRGDVVSKHSHVTVGWQADSEVQIGVGVGSRFQFEPRQSPAYDEPEFHTDLWFTITERRQVNDLIRNLRRARDAAFGADA